MDEKKINKVKSTFASSLKYCRMGNEFRLCLNQVGIRDIEFVGSKNASLGEAGKNTSMLTIAYK